MHEIACPLCGQEQSVELWDSINVDSEPELREALLLNRVNRVECAGCGKGFSWGYCPTSNQWDSGGPRWFRSEQHTYHSECCGKSAASAQTEA